MAPGASEAWRLEDKPAYYVFASPFSRGQAALNEIRAFEAQIHSSDEIAFGAALSKLQEFGQMYFTNIKSPSPELLAIDILVSAVAANRLP